MSQNIADRELDAHDAGTVQFVLSHTPTIDAEIIRHGRWVEQNNTFYDATCGEDVHYFTFVCSTCNAEAMNHFPYCPWCGAKMYLKD